MDKLNLANIYDWPRSLRLVIASLIFLGGLYLGYLADISNLWHELAVEEQQESELRSQLAGKIKKQITLQTQTAQFTQLTQIYDFAKAKIIPYSQLTELLNSILKVGETEQVYLASFSPGESITENDYIKIPIKVILMGGYQQISHFMSKLSNLEHYIIIRSFNISLNNSNDLSASKQPKSLAINQMLIAELYIDVYHLPLTNTRTENTMNKANGLSTTNQGVK